MALKSELDTDLITRIRNAVDFLDYKGTDSSPRGAVAALRQATQAVQMVRHLQEGVVSHRQQEMLFTMLDEAAKTLRDALTVRAQLVAFPIGDNKKFHAIPPPPGLTIIDIDERPKVTSVGGMDLFRYAVKDKKTGRWYKYIDVL